MTQMFEIYKWTILAGGVAAVLLSLIGCQIAARDKAVQTLCLAQGSMLGVLVGLAFLASAHDGTSEFAAHAGPFFTAALCAASVAFLGEVIVVQKQASKNSYFTAFFAVILALNYFVSALFPALEGHMAQVFFGDLATLSQFDVFLTLGLSVVLLLLYVTAQRRITDQSFANATFGETGTFKTRDRALAAVNVTAFLYLCYSIQFLGFLFTIACLFLPTAILSLSGVIGLRRHLFGVAVLSFAGAVNGFFFSLQNPNWPTVPAIVECILLLGLALIACLRILSRFAK